ncbi:hypothetical protein [Aquimarina sp. 2304DJ70-9]|uniref:hypothetical protein n=1 Tax=Aquimarina penaris TaxID=3231044 RepID=UPI003463159C
MKKLPLYILFIALMNQAYSQIGPNDANALMGLPTATDLTEINAILNPQIGSVVFNLADEEIYRYTGLANGWQIATDDQTDAEVSLTTPIDVDEAGATSTTNETNLQEVIEAIAPITSGAARVFYPPSIAIDATSTGAKTPIDLYQLYVDQFGTPIAASDPVNAPTIPVYNRNELYYYVTFADENVFGNPTTISLDSNGNMSYSIVNLPTDFNTIINVVFVVR